jgi:trehalose 6-phosphate phosphatase
MKHVYSSAKLSSFPKLTRDAALFLDLDGTLAEIMQTPEQVHIQPNILKSLSRLSEQLQGALAVVSGRTIANIDRLCSPFHFAAAGQHGLEFRNHDQVDSVVEHIEILNQFRNEIMTIHKRYPTLLIEYKGSSFALHYRQAPTIGALVYEDLQKILSSYPQFFLQNGKMVWEICLCGAGKGLAIQHFMNCEAFHNRSPFFIGDDVSDEDGFESVNGLGGISIKIGTGKTIANYRMTNVTELGNWLEQQIEALA